MVKNSLCYSYVALFKLLSDDAAKCIQTAFCSILYCCPNSIRLYFNLLLLFCLCVGRRIKTNKKLIKYIIKCSCKLFSKVALEYQSY